MRGGQLSIYVTPTDRFFGDCISECGLLQLVTEATYISSGNILDLILCSDADRFFDVECLSPLPQWQHCPVVAGLIYQGSSQREGGSMEKFAWSRGNYRRFAEALFDIDWEGLFDGHSAPECYKKLCERVWELVPQFVPEQGVRKEGQWLAKPPRSLKNRRKVCWSRYKMLRNQLGRRHVEVQQAWEDYSAVNSSYRAYSLNFQSSYEEKLAELLKISPKVFHSYLRSRKKGCPSVGPLRAEDGSLVADQGMMCNIFADAFISVYIADPPSNPSQHQSTHAVMDEFTLSFDELLRKLLELDPSSSAGPDGIHPRLMKECAQVLVSPLCQVLRKSLDEGLLPEEWKVSRVVPIFKGGSKAVALNYRPVSLTSTPCKIMERLLVDHIVDYLEGNSLLEHGQFGFRQGRGVEDQLLLMYGEVVERVDAGGTVEVVYLDLSKAFDVVNHQLLLTKLNELGFSRKVLGWIEVFLVGRKMCVSVGMGNSQPRPVLSGVPQGSVLGPLLFLVYVNNLTERLTSKWYAFVIR